MTRPRRRNSSQTVSCASGTAFSPLARDTHFPIAAGYKVLTFQEYQQFQNALELARKSNILFPTLEQLGLAYLNQKFYLVNDEDLERIYSPNKEPTFEVVSKPGNLLRWEVR